MAVQPSDVQSPNGEIEDFMFPAHDSNELDTRIQNWIDDATNKNVVSNLSTQAEKDAATIAWVYYQAYSAVDRRLKASPAELDNQDGQARAYAEDQRASFRQLAIEKRDEFEQITDVQEEQQDAFAENRSLASSSVQNETVW